MSAQWRPTCRLSKGWKTLCLLLLFVSGLIFQPLLSARVLKVAEDGGFVVICTLQGLKRIPVSELETLGTVGKAECPACTLNNLLASAAIQSTPPPSFTPQVFAPAQVSADTGKPQRSIYAPRMRAPPSVLS